MRKTIKRVLAGAMALGLAATMMPGLSMSAKADFTHLTNTNTFQGVDSTRGNAAYNTQKITGLEIVASNGWDVPRTATEAGAASAKLSYLEPNGTNSGKSVTPAVTLDGTFATSYDGKVEFPTTGDVDVNAANATDFGVATMTVTNVTGMVRLWNIEDTTTDNDEEKDKYSITKGTLDPIVANSAADGEFHPTASNVEATPGNRTLRNNQSMKDIEVTPKANYMWSKTGEKKIVGDTKSGDVILDDTTRANSAAKGTLANVTDNVNILKVTGIVPDITVTATETGTAADEIDVFNKKADNGNLSLYGGERGGNQTIVGSDDLHNEGDAAYPFKVARATTATVDAELIDIQEITYESADGKVKGTIAVKSPGLNDYEIPADVMKKLAPGQKLTITVKSAKLKRVNLTGAVGNTNLVFTSDSSKYKVQENSYIMVPDNETVIVNAETPVGTKYAQEPTDKFAPEGTTIGNVNAAETGIPIEIDGESVVNKATVRIRDGLAPESFPEDARIKKDAGNKGVEASAADANNGKNTTGTESSDTTTGQTGNETPAVSTGFADDSDIADYAKPYIKAAAEAGIIKGKENNRFDPRGGATRAEFATMIQRALGLKADKTESRFSDVKAPLNEDLINGVLACEDIDPFIVQGYPDGTFQPGKQITRAEGILMIWRAVGKPAYTGAAKFNDLADWYAEAANWGAEQGIVQGVGGGRFDGGATLTRQDLATMLGRAIEKGIIKLPTAAADDKADEAKTDGTATDESKTDESKTDGAADGEKTDAAAEGEKTEA